MQKEQILAARRRTVKELAAAGIQLTDVEQANVEVADFGLGELELQGLEIVTYVNNDRYCAKELVLFPRQTCPEHLHPLVGDEPGKMETFRCRAGVVYLYVEGKATSAIAAQVPPGSEAHYTVFHEVALRPGEQYTIMPGIKHWFQAGDAGAIVSEFSSTSRDEFDLFTDPRIARMANL
ncbi:D-lyxose/D-mannose family sugar isomerase [Paenibacillus ferrarius]|uniref:D-lyxose/D-mannose family sugar isomerase n=1 Tax=Paenibacillus ferrarius TaxID=1469647 RepID=UPI003D2741D7